MLLFKYVLTSNVALTHTPSPSLLKLFFKFKPFFIFAAFCNAFPTVRRGGASLKASPNE